MKKLLSLLLVGMMLLSLAACGKNQTPSGSEGDNHGTSQSGGNNDVTVRIAAIDGYELPDAALAYVGTFNKAYNDQYNDGEITFYVKSTNADDDAFDALVDYYASNGGTLDEENSTRTTKCFDFTWGRIEAAHFGVDEKISAYIILPEYPIADNGGEENKDDIKYVMTFEENTNPNPTADTNWTVNYKVFEFGETYLKSAYYVYKFDSIEDAEKFITYEKETMGTLNELKRDGTTVYKYDDSYDGASLSTVKSMFDESDYTLTEK